VKAARSAKCAVVTFSGFTADNPLRRLGDINFYGSSGNRVGDFWSWTPHKAMHGADILHSGCARNVAPDSKRCFSMLTAVLER
jgi:hypothetical protein